MMESNMLQTVPILRRDLHFILQYGKDRAYIIEDRMRQKYYRIGNEEYLLMARLDGKTCLGEAVSRTNAALNKQVFDDEHAKIIFEWLKKSQLLSNESEAMLTDRSTGFEREKQLRNLGRLNFLNFKIPLCNPDSFFAKIAPWCGWLAGQKAAVLWLILLGYSLLILAEQWPNFIKQTSLVMSPGNLFSLWLAWFLLKLVHEFSHALTCYRYHGRVYEAGVMFILFFPLTYVNASSSWRFPSKWQRMHAAFAGIYAELFIAAIAVLGWAASPHSILGEMAHHVVIIAGFSTLAFNINPLMRFDGYFILSDMLDIPNLYARGKELVSSLASAVFFRKWTYISRFSTGQEIFIGSYGFAAWLWRIAVITTMVLIASQMFHGFGVFFTIPAIAAFIGYPLWSLKEKLTKIKREDPGRFKYFVLVSGSIVTFSTLFLGLVELNIPRLIPAVVQYTDEHPVKSSVPGFVAEIFVVSGGQVEKDDKLLRLHNPDIDIELKEARLAEQILELRERSLLMKKELAQYQVLAEQKAALRQKLAVLEKDAAALTIHAPAKGIVMGKNLEEKIETYIQAGQDLLTIVSDNDKKLLASVSQDDIAFFRTKEGEAVEVLEQNSWRTAFSGTITSIHPKADTTIPAFALNAAYGGPIPVQQTGTPQNSGLDRGYEFITPRFSVDITIPIEQAKNLPPGLLLNLRVGGQATTGWQLLTKWSTEHFLKRI